MTNGSIKYVESVKESHGGRMSHDGGRSSSSSNSSLNDESHVVEENIVVIEYRESKEDALSSVAKSDAFENVVKIAGMPKITPVIDSVLVMDACDLAVDEPKEQSLDAHFRNPDSSSLNFTITHLFSSLIKFELHHHPPEGVVKYYTGDDLYLFDKFQTTRVTNFRRPKIGKGSNSIFLAGDCQIW
ncbi:hypothetical protein LOK49_LG03G01110 [Camellia lanceoleosa]|uniref:Uncharacterized protein n=1 Tax=Camellia lanceoleosa TaxID=1840588 RepID=A0ACC0IDE0_9ERIC|nr:hypothetical protein LOK49_LG03G01110 [Camellia lanceoleosa]